MPADKTRIGPATRVATWLACGFGLGYSPVASGTVGTLLGLPLAWLMVSLPSSPWMIPLQLLFCGVLVALAIWCCHLAEAHYKVKDDGRIVADEYLIFPISMIGLPGLWWVYLMAFLTSRFFDILKPPPARQMERLGGGLGIVADDVMAACYALAANHLIFYLIGLS
jgi:phosphatidylglycerophosphatase A